MVSQPADIMPQKKEEPQHLQLELDQSPSSIFYKDEGGKSNYLTASCLVAVAEDQSSFPIGNLKLSPRLVYESGGEIEDEDEIFNVLNVEPKTITSTNETFTVNFRIEKVSRRKDGKRFRVRFDVNKQKSHLLDYVTVDKLAPIETNPVTVLSKRKSHAHLQVGSLIPQIVPMPSITRTDDRKRSAISSMSEKPKRRRPSANVDQGKKKTSVSQASVDNESDDDILSHANSTAGGNVTLPVDFLLKLKDSITRLETTVTALSDRVANLEQRKFSPNRSPSALNLPAANTGVFNRGHRVHSLMFDEAFHEMANNSNNQNSSGNCGKQGGIKRNTSSTTELFEFLTTSSILN